MSINIKNKEAERLLADLKARTGRGTTDLLLAGNFDGFKPEIGRLAAGHGLLLRGLGGGRFEPVPATESGFFVPGQARDIQRLRTRAGSVIAVTRNNDRPLLFRLDGRAAARLVAAGTPRAR